MCPVKVDVESKVFIRFVCWQGWQLGGCVVGKVSIVEGCICGLIVVCANFFGLICMKFLLQYVLSLANMLASWSAEFAMSTMSSANAWCVIDWDFLKVPLKWYLRYHCSGDRNIAKSNGEIVSPCFTPFVSLIAVVRPCAVRTSVEFPFRSSCIMCTYWPRFMCFRMFSIELWLTESNALTKSMYAR